MQSCLQQQPFVVMKGLRLNLKPITKHSSEQQLASQSKHSPQMSRRSEQSEQIDASNQSAANYNEEYSFNHISGTERSVRSLTPSENHIYRPEGEQEANDTMRTNPQLLKKYSSIYEQLKGIEHFEVIQLFLEEIEENERNKQKIAEMERSASLLEEELSEVREMVRKKREAIQTLCQTETNNLNMIECLERQIADKNFMLDSHYQQKYRELETYMNEYIGSTNEAQEEFKKNYKLIKSENIRLAVINQSHNEALLEKEKLLDICQCKNLRSEKAIALLKEKEATLLIKIENVQEENLAVKKELQNLLENMRAIDQFSIEVARENRDLSSELDLIREKVNENSNISLDISDKLKEHSEQNQKLLRDIDQLTSDNEQANQQVELLKAQMERLEAMLQQARKDRAESMDEKQVLMEDYQQICKRLEMVTTEKNQLALLLQEREEEVEHLTQEIKSLNQYQEDLMVEFENEKESKNAIKEQLLDLAEQVRFMESTYKKEVVTNEKIKEELHKFWEKKDKNSRVLRPVISNDSLEREGWKKEKLSRCQSMNQSASSSGGNVPYKWKESSENTENRTFS